MSTTERVTTGRAFRYGQGDGVADVWWPFSAGVARYTQKVTGAESGGRLFQMVVTEPHGAAPPVHIHRDADETFYVLDGELTFFADGEEISAFAGDFVFVPRGRPHTFLVRSPSARMLVTFGPAGAEGFFTKLGADASGGHDKPAAQAPDPELFARVADSYGMDIVGPPPALD